MPIRRYMTHYTGPTTPHRLMSAAEVAALLGVSRRTVERATVAGVLPHRRIGGERSARYTLDDINEYVTTIRHVGRNRAPVGDSPPETCD